MEGSGSVSAVRLSGGFETAGPLIRGGDLGEQPFTGYDAWSVASRIEASLAAGRPERPADLLLLEVEREWVRDRDSLGIDRDLCG